MAILLVDDDDQQLELRAEALRLSGLSVVTASSPVDALRIGAETAVELNVAVLDYDMPGMDGCALADELRVLRPELRIILYSGAVDIPMLECKVDVFVPKADGLTALLAHIVEPPGSDLTSQ